MNKFSPFLLSLTASSLLCLSSMTVYAEDNNNVETFNLTDLPSLEFDELLATDVQVTSAMKRLQNMSETAASIYVLTNKEIIDSGVTSVAQALKLVPGMQVRQIDNNQWAITLRSTAGKYSSKLLVMIDGQSIYNPGFAGVYWEALNTPLYDIERIEVIRGQGGLLWGSNANNGVVNIITKHTSDTRGALAQVETGNLIDYKTSFRAGGELGNYNSFRVYGSIEQTDASNENMIDVSPNDDGKKKNIGARVDVTINDDLSLLTQAEYSNIDMGQVIKLPNLTTYAREYVQDKYTREHFQLMSRLEHRLSSDSNQMLQTSLSYQAGEQTYYDDRFVISDIDYQMNTLIRNIQFDWGLNYRYTDISVPDNGYISTDITHTVQYGGFVQAQFNIIPDKFKLIIGNRTEKNSYTGWEHQPMARLLWQLNDNHTFWMSASQGVRIPSLLEYDSELLVTYSQPVKIVIAGNTDSDAETSFSKDLGYRYAKGAWAFDASIFHTKSKDVMVIEPEYGFDYTTYTYNVTYNIISNAELVTYGGELSLKWQPIKDLSMELGYSFTSYDYNLESGTVASIGYDSILRQVIGKVNYAITPKHSLFAMYRIEGGEAYDTDDFSVLDLSWNWKIKPNMSFSVTGNNLFYGKHIEYNNTAEVYSVPTYIEPSYIARFTMEF